MGSIDVEAHCAAVGGLTRVTATTEAGASMAICLHGGQLLSWRTAEGEEQGCYKVANSGGPPGPPWTRDCIAFQSTSH